MWFVIAGGGDESLATSDSDLAADLWMNFYFADTIRVYLWIISDLWRSMHEQYFSDERFVSWRRELGVQPAHDFVQAWISNLICSRKLMCAHNLVLRHGIISHRMNLFVWSVRESTRISLKATQSRQWNCTKNGTKGDAQRYKRNLKEFAHCFFACVCLRST